MHTLIVCLIIIVIYLCIYFIVKNKCTKLEKFYFEASSTSSTPNVLLVGTAHGNEPAGSEALIKFVDMIKSGKLRLKKGSITVIPTMNPCGKKLGLRWQPHQVMTLRHIDLNRNFAKRRGEEGGCPVSNEVMKFAINKDLVIDFHEGWGFNKLQPDSMGSGIYPGSNTASHPVAKEMQTAVNSGIPDINKQFILRDWPDLPGTFRWFCDRQNVPYILIETTGQDDIQPIDVRVKQDLVLLIAALQKLDMIEMD
jgi:predicted deacylase